MGSFLLYFASYPCLVTLRPPLKLYWGSELVFPFPPHTLRKIPSWQQFSFDQRTYPTVSLTVVTPDKFKKKYRWCLCALLLLWALFDSAYWFYYLCVGVVNLCITSFCCSLRLWRVLLTIIFESCFKLQLFVLCQRWVVASLRLLSSHCVSWNILKLRICFWPACERRRVWAFIFPLSYPARLI